MTVTQINSDRPLYTRRPHPFGMHTCARVQPSMDRSPCIIESVNVTHHCVTIMRVWRSQVPHVRVEEEGGVHVRRRVAEEPDHRDAVDGRMGHSPAGVPQGGYPGWLPRGTTPGYYVVPAIYPGVPTHYPGVPRGREGSLGMHVPGSLVPGDPLTYTGWGYGVPRGCTTPGLGYGYQGVPRGPDGNQSGSPGVPLGGGTHPGYCSRPYP